VSVKSGGVDLEGWDGGFGVLCWCLVLEGLVSEGAVARFGGFRVCGRRMFGGVMRF